MERTSNATSFKVLPADLRRLIEETENSVSMLYSSVDQHVPPRGSKKKQMQSRSTRHGHSTRQRAHRTPTTPSTDSRISDDAPDSDAHDASRSTGTRHRTTHATQQPKRTGHRTRRTQSLSATESSQSSLSSYSEALPVATSRHRQRAPRNDGGQARASTRQPLPAAPPSRRSRAYRHVTYPDDEEDEEVEEEECESSPEEEAVRPSQTRGAVPAPASLLYTRKPASLSHAPPAPAGNGLCESNLLPTAADRTVENYSVLSRRSGAPTEATTPTRMLTQFGHRWDARYRQMLDKAAETSLDRTLSSGAASPANGRGLTPGAAAATAVAMGTVPPAPTTPSARTPRPVDDAQGKTAPVSAVAPVLHSPALSAQLAAVLSQRDALEETVRLKERELLEGERQHLQQLATLHEDIAKAKLDGAQEAREHLATSASLKESILQAALETERQRTADANERAKEAEKALREARRSLDEQATNLVLQDRTSVLRDHELEGLRQRVESLETQLTRAVADRRDTEETARRTQMELSALHERCDAAQRAHDAAESRATQQEASAKATLAQLEAEFEEATARYQALLDEATRRVDHLEKVQRKYKSLKDTHQRVSETTEEATNTLRRQLAERDTLVETLQKELQAVRNESIKLQELLVAKDDASEEKLRSAQRQLELKGASSSEQVKTLQQHLETANHTIELLRTQIDSLKEELREEQVQAQQADMRTAQSELRLKEEVIEQQREAAVAKTRHGEAVAALKQQLKEKNAKLEALAATSMEPLQRLREQLESERGKRAQLETQLSRLRKRAKEAEEVTLRELRREQLRQSTEAAALLQMTPSAARSAPHASSAGPLVASGPGGGGGAGTGSVLGSGHRHTPATYASVPSWAAQSARSSRLASANARSDTRARHEATRSPAAADNEEENDDNHQHHHQHDRHGRQSPPSARREGSHSPPQVQTTALVESALAPDKDDATAVFQPSLPPPPSLGEWQDARQRRLPPPPSRLGHRDPETGARTAAAAAATFQRVAPDASTDAALPTLTAVPQDRSRTSPATVGSLSGISRSSPCNSTSRLDEEATERLDAEGGASAAAGPVRPVPRSRTASPSAGPLTAGHIVSLADEAEAGVERDHRMREFHASAAEVLRRISDSRESFMSRCTQVIQRSSALGTQSAVRGEDIQGEPL